MNIIISPFNSPTLNCALEEYMVTERHDDVLLLYINTPSVIVGKYQTIEAEADVNYCKANGIEIVRRISGGGAVYHDEGNINYAFIVSKNDALALDRDFTEPIIAALQHLGVNASMGKRKEIRCGKYKISGTAAHVSRDRQLFHGTLLYNTNLEKLSHALKGNTALRGRGIASVPDKVRNIADILKNNEKINVFFENIQSFLTTYLKQNSVKSLSQNEIEIITQFHFSKTINATLK